MNNQERIVTTENDLIIDQIKEGMRKEAEEKKKAEEFNSKDVDILGMNKEEPKPKKRDELGVFVGQTRAHLVEGSVTFKVPNMSHVCEHPEYIRHDEERPLTELEQLYKEFCEKAIRVILSQPEMNGANHPHQIIFPDFKYKVIPSKFLIAK